MADLDKSDKSGILQPNSPPPPPYQDPSQNPNTGYPPPGSYPNTGYPPPGSYPNTGYPPPGSNPNTGYPPPGSYPNPGYPPPGSYPNTGYPPPGSYPNPGYPPPESYPNTSAHQQYGAPVGPYGQGPYPGYHAVAVQPTVYVTATPLVNPLPDYLGYSIFTMLCCCLPLGIAAFVFSLSTRNANMSGHQQEAEKNSKMAITLNHAALGIGLTLIVLYIILVFVSIA